MNTHRANILAIGLTSTLASTAQLARAQSTPSVDSTPGYLSEYVAGPRNALELTLGSSYTQGFGEYQKGVAGDLPDIAGVGVDADVGIGYRLSPGWMFGATAGYQAYRAGDIDGNTSAAGATARIDATYHLSATSRLDPWVKAGVGYRYLCECGTDANRKGVKLHGLELLNLTTGFDIRVDRYVALSPMIGASMTTFLWERIHSIADPRLSVFAYAGLQARFDIGGSYGQSSVASR